jgi:hypothetical protein
MICTPLSLPVAIKANLSFKLLPFLVFERNMEPPLQVAEDQDGIYRDVHDRPMILVFNSTKIKPEATGEARPESKAAVSQTKSPFAFVQVSGSKKEDRKARTLIRTHVMQDHFRRKHEKAPKTRPQNTKLSGESVQASVVESNGRFELYPLPPQPTGNLDPFARYPIEMKPRTHLLAHHCECTNPISSPHLIY